MNFKRLVGLGVLMAIVWYCSSSKDEEGTEGEELSENMEEVSDAGTDPIPDDNDPLSDLEAPAEGSDTAG
jgi:hypothetical protein